LNDDHLKKMKLTDKQIEFLAEKFFTSQTCWPGAGRIANELLVAGECIVAGEGRIWHGGVGNFICSKPVPGAVGCSLLRFDLDGFLSRPWVREYIAAAEAELRLAAEDLQASIAALRELACRGPKRGVAV
jgi:hypothetical protein